VGLRNIADAAPGASSSGGYPQLSSEFIVQANPDYVFLADSICCGQTMQTVASRPGWSAVTAVTARQVVVINDDIASRWGPRIVELLRTVARALEKHRSGP
jgi:iron complex transport system substrate-binding protein